MSTSPGDQPQERQPPAGGAFWLAERAGGSDGDGRRGASLEDQRQLQRPVGVPVPDERDPQAKAAGAVHQLAGISAGNGGHYRQDSQRPAKKRIGLGWRKNAGGHIRVDLVDERRQLVAGGGLVRPVV